MTRGGNTDENFDAGNCFAVFYWLVVGTTATWFMVIAFLMYYGVL